MQSHSYDFKPRELLRLITPIAVGILIFVGVMHGAGKVGLLPKPRPTLDMERTILIHQADAARSSSEATIILIGDSSCLMNVSARIVSERLATPALNLGTFSYLGLSDYGALLRARQSANPTRQDTVVLLMHPEALRRPGADRHYSRILADYMTEVDYCEGSDLYHRLSCGMGLEILRGRILTRVLPHPLSGQYAEAYGFTSALDRYLTEERGSLIDVEPKTFSGNAEYRLADQLEAQSQTFRQTLPAGCKLLVGITPAPETFVRAGYAEQYQQMLNTWSGWLRADAALTNLPPTLPDRLFSKVTHLNSDGVAIYSEELARSVRTVK